MKKLLLVTVIIGLLCLTSGCLPPEKTDDIKADEAAIAKLMETYAATISDGDVEGFMALWANDGIRMGPNAPALLGKEQIRAHIENLWSRFNVKVTVINSETRVAGDWAYARGAYTYDVAAKDGSTSRNGAGKYLSILERQSDGSWKIQRDCYNDNAPPQ